MQDRGLVSIITPTYNCGRFIGETIESVQAQTYPNWEMLIIDDCSTDDTAATVKRYSEKDHRIKYHCLDKNSGAAVSRNTALQMAKGRWIAFLDSDDLWAPEKLEHQIDFMRNNNYSFSSTERDEINEQSEFTGNVFSGPDRVTKLKMYCYCWPGCLTVMYDADKIGLIQIPDIKKNNDYAIWLRAVKKADCFLLHENLAHYRVRKGSISNVNHLHLIKWHYKLFRDVENLSIVKSLFWTGCNIFFGIVKRVRYVKRIRKN